MRHTSFGMPTAGGLSCCGWMQLPLDSGTNANPRSMLWLGTSTTAPDLFEFLTSHRYTGTEVAQAIGYKAGLTGGGGYPDVLFVPAILGVWYFIAGTFHPTGSMSTCFIGREGEEQFFASAANTRAGTATATENGLYIGQPSAAITVTAGQGACANIRFWSRVLSGPEFQAEMMSESPVSQNSLHAWYPMKNSNQNKTFKGTDFSGNGRHLTADASGPSNYDWPDPEIGNVRRNTRRRRSRRPMRDVVKWQVA